MGRHHRRRWRSAARCHRFAAREVCDEGRRGCEKRIRQFPATIGSCSIWIFFWRKTILCQKPKPTISDRLSFRKLKDTYFLGAIASLAALATRNFTTVFALI